ncbi:acyl-CoA carboxylase subunit beta [Mycolicibacterium diernhoferi]|uniref:Acyl-CoA carboxylase subunit beta n=1 Tax=Mycolicibacterium diernhoferi TaxID=1801 RepID=A0A1Q4HLV2_9MYCO|nr:acyl-CoA carboxylase subunit beta [Mycolicibacterium diernhoferi]OJZ68510.1 propionyl-CoA carboxylase subunit beta [Mycolicibacterium diernhoferi]OPE56166.1 propionyl-CoA carboxylase subunit beta [Mycolicibacterium diernhoferi]PEG54469.1 acyl-CoA carboxylase subunit beta [Mycolicibacterium diernhoferi]QYL20989.1 acyl-CoA carboxylase subunit beta [Mycolicibacterium diernhoferi]
MTIMAPEAAAESLDPRDPLLRLKTFFDDGSVSLLHERDKSGVLAAAGTVNGVRTIAFCTDGTVMGGAMGIEGCAHIVNAYDVAIEEQSPIVGIWHSGGARLAEGVKALHAVGLVFEAMIRASGYVPQISVVVGFAAGGAAYGPALTDVIVMAPDSKVFVTGPDVVRSVTGEDVDMVSLGGPEAHHKKSGVCHIVADDELDAYERGRRLVGLFCQQGHFDRSKAEAGDTDLKALMPESARRAYDVHPIVEALLDKDSHFEEFQSRWAPSIVVGLGRLAGRTVGVIANNPLRLGGCLNSESAEKSARFVRLCDAFGIPLVVVVDVPGYLPGVDQEWGGVVRRGAKLLHAFGEATVPRVTLVTRKIYGGAYIAMNSRSLGATKVFAWPEAEVAVMGAKAAVGILHKRKLAAAADDERDALHEELAAEHERIAGGVDSAIEIGVVDAKIDPAHTRSVITQALAEAPARRGRHKNIPL